MVYSSNTSSAFSPGTGSLPSLCPQRSWGTGGGVITHHTPHLLLLPHIYRLGPPAPSPSMSSGPAPLLGPTSQQGLGALSPPPEELPVGRWGQLPHQEIMAGPDKTHAEGEARESH